MTQETLKQLANEMIDTLPFNTPEYWIGRIKEALAQQEQEPVAMRMPKVGDKVVCIEDDSLGVVAYLTAGGSPEIMFDDGSHGTYLLREFAELFRYTTPQSTWQGLTDEEHNKLAVDWGCLSADWILYAAAVERAVKEKNS